MNKKLAAVVALLACALALVTLLFPGDRESTVRGPREIAEPDSGPSTVLAAPPTVPEPTAPAPAERVEAAVATPAVAPAPWAGALAGLAGRIVEEDGTPVPGIRVALLEAEGTLLFQDVVSGSEPSLQLEETRTGEDGRFLLGGARAPAFHGLGIDLGGPRATLRVLDSALPHGVRTDLGDIVLAPFGVLTGRVVDEAGAPVAGARVRVAALPEELIEYPTYDFRGDSLLAVTMLATTGQGHGILELPAWVQKNVDRLPIPTTYSDEEGAFRLEGAALTNLVGGIDKKGHVGAPVRVDLSSGAADLGDVVLARGRTITGVVEDTYGEPLPGIEVFAGAEIVPGVVAILHSAGRSDENGEFTLEGVGESGQVVAAARRSRHEAWSTTVAADPTDVLVELGATLSLAVEVTDDAGEPVTGARIRLTPKIAAGKGMMGVAELMMILPGNTNRSEVFVEVEPGRYVNGELTPGLYEIVAYKEGLTPGVLVQELLEEETTVSLRCLPGAPLEVTVVDAVTGSAVEDSKVSVLRASAEGFLNLGSTFTDAAGLARLGPLRDFRSDTSKSFFSPETLVLVQHPGYGDATERYLTGSPTMRIELARGGVVAGRVHWGGAVPAQVYMVLLEPRGGADGFSEMFHPPRMCLTDLEGGFRVANLEPGKYQLELVERFLDRDPTGLFNDDFNPVTLYRESVQVVDGETTEVEIDLSPTGRGPTATLRGRVRVDGANVEGATVEIRGNERVKVTTDSWGRFEAQDFSVLRSVRVQIQGEVVIAGAERRSMNLYEESFELQNGDVREIDVDLYPLSIEVQVADALTGAPIEEASISADARSTSAAGGKGFRDREPRTAAGGLATVLLPNPGKFLLSASAEGYTRGSLEVDVPDGGLQTPASLRLEAAIPCAGRVSVPAGTVQGGFAYIHVRSEDNSVSEGTVLQAPEYTFQFDKMKAGKYTGYIYLSNQRCQVNFELPPQGETDLVLDFIPQ